VHVDSFAVELRRESVKRSTSGLYTELATRFSQLLISAQERVALGDVIRTTFDILL
jgi:hypothetical protein